MEPPKLDTANPDHLTYRNGMLDIAEYFGYV
jgi:hypothetical protein